ncbi:hypothetical protein CMUS01_01844 [Colletotrichum musicola]|uniref:DUF7137 domain-containing protein n=1 Tax=Colletotrichum musicola TaxID=2175873 RepID=A0A8H6NW78_9PEZI|nr:hypothetical protein CMUS01_01844 [Colletotrichum musicola]
MKAVQTLAVGLAAFAPLASAWPKWLPEIDALVVRQNDETSSAGVLLETGAATNTRAASATTGPTATPATAEATNTGGAKTTNLNTAKAPSTTRTGSATGTETGKAKATEFDETDPVGSVVMVEPAVTANSINLYKIGDYVTWKWNYTNVQATPTAIDVLVSCSDMAKTWTLTANMSWAEPASFTWDTKVQATDPSSGLRNAEYTLIIYDAESSVSATPSPGYLGVANSFKFGMYAPKDYQNLTEWICPSCKSAATTLDKQGITLAMGMSVVTVASFTWFVAGLGLF